MPKTLRALQAIFLISLIPSLSACDWFKETVLPAPNPYAGMTDEEQLKTRAQERWDALIAMDMARVYTFATPSYRASFDQLHHAGQYGGQVKRTRATVNKIEIDEAGTTAKVQMELWAKTSVAGGEMIEIATYVNGTWVKRDGIWWFVEPR